MIVCLCKGITEQRIRKAVREGAVTLDQVGLICSAGTDCGCCHQTIALIIRDETRRSQEPAPVVLPTLAAAS